MMRYTRGHARSFLHIHPQLPIFEVARFQFSQPESEGLSFEILVRAEEFLADA